MSAADSRGVLLVDLGNTNLKWRRPGPEPGGPVRSAGHRDRPLRLLLDECWHDSPRPGAVLVSSVAGGDAEETLRRWCAAHWGLAPAMVRSTGHLLGITNGYRDSAQLGVDRLLAMGAVRSRLQGPFCLVDCGTAVTLDAVDASGAHLGGLILPGFTMMHWALQRGTAIPPYGEPGGLELLARDTATAIESGPVHALAALVDRMLDRLGEEGEAPGLVVTGRDAGRLEPALDREFHPMENLVIEGLTLLAAQRDLS